MYGGAGVVRRQFVLSLSCGSQEPDSGHQAPANAFISYTIFPVLTELESVKAGFNHRIGFVVAIVSFVLRLGLI